MSATANLFVPEQADLKGEPEFSSPIIVSDLLEDNLRIGFEHPDEDGACEAIVRHYESLLNAAGGAVLHLGAGRGDLMETLRQHGFMVMDCEQSPGPARLARMMHGFGACTLHCSSAEDFLYWMQRIGQKAQAVFFSHSWEHNLEFQALLSRIAEILHDGGRIIAVMPPAGASHPREAHLSFLNELALAGASSSASFEVETVDCDFDNRFMAFVLRKANTTETSPAAARQGCGTPDSERPW